MWVPEWLQQARTAVRSSEEGLGRRRFDWRVEEYGVKTRKGTRTVLQHIGECLITWQGLLPAGRVGRPGPAWVAHPSLADCQTRASLADWHAAV